MSLLETFVNNAEDLEASLNKIRGGGIPEIFGKKHLMSLGFDVTESVLYSSLFSALELVDENGKPAPEFERFVRSDQDARRLAREKLWAGYKKIFAIDSQAHHRTHDQTVEIFQKAHNGNKSHTFINLVVQTFRALVKYADWSPETKTQDAQQETEQYVNIQGSTIKIGSGRVIVHDYCNQSEEKENEGAQQEKITASNGKDSSPQPGTAHASNGTDSSQQEKITASNGRDSSPQPGTAHASNGTDSVQSKSANNFTEKNNGLGRETSNGEGNMQSRTGTRDARDSHTFAKALLKKADLLQKMDRHEEAVNVLDQILAYYEKGGQPGSENILSKILIRKAELLEKSCRYEQALSAYEEYIHRFGDSDISSNNRMIS